MRKIIQIAVTGVANTQSTQCDYVTVALCDDGTAWEIDNRRSCGGWNQLPPITQDYEMPVREPVVGIVSIVTAGCNHTYEQIGPHLVCSKCHDGWPKQTTASHQEKPHD